MNLLQYIHLFPKKKCYQKVKIKKQQLKQLLARHLHLAAKPNPTDYKYTYVHSLGVSK